METFHSWKELCHSAFESHLVLQNYSTFELHPSFEFHSSITPGAMCHIVQAPLLLYSRIRTIWGFHNKSNLELLCCHLSSAALPTWSLSVIFALFNKNPMQAMSKRVLNPGKKKTQNLWPKSPDQPLLCLSSPVNESFAAFHHTQQEWGVHTI